MNMSPRLAFQCRSKGGSPAAALETINRLDYPFVHRQKCWLLDRMAKKQPEGSAAETSKQRAMTSGNWAERLYIASEMAPVPIKAWR